MELNIFKRTVDKKSEKKNIRKHKDIPAVLYGNGSNENIYIKLDEFEKILNNIPEGRLSTTVFTLVDGKKKFKALVKDIQYHITSYRIIHIDFFQINDKKPFEVRVPIECDNAIDCVGVKLGGALRKVIRKLKVRCLLENMPNVFKFDIANMNIGDAKKLSDIEIPANVKALGPMHEVAIAITKR